MLGATLLGCLMVKFVLLHVDLHVDMSSMNRLPEVTCVRNICIALLFLKKDYPCRPQPLGNPLPFKIIIVGVYDFIW